MSGDQYLWERGKEYDDRIAGEKTLTLMKDGNVVATYNFAYVMCTQLVYE